MASRAAVMLIVAYGCSTALVPPGSKQSPLAAADAAVADSPSADPADPVDVAAPAEVSPADVATVDATPTCADPLHTNWPVCDACADPHRTGPDCKTCVGLSISVQTSEGIVCAPGAPTWGHRPLSPDTLQVQGDVVVDSQTLLHWQRTASTVHRTWQDSLAWCDALTLGGQSDWRLPVPAELESLVDYLHGDDDAALDPTVFPDAPSTGFYWTAAPTGWAPDKAWSSQASSGDLWWKSKSEAGLARCVRGTAPIAPDAHLVVEKGGDTVRDIRTGLQWQRAEPELFVQQPGGIDYCADLVLAGHDDWRLPDIRELVWLADRSRTEPTIDVTAFPSATAAKAYWSATPWVGGGAAWGVSYFYGLSGFNLTTSPGRARCVRFATP